VTPQHVDAVLADGRKSITAGPPPACDFPSQPTVLGPPRPVVACSPPGGSAERCGSCAGPGGGFSLLGPAGAARCRRHRAVESRHFRSRALAGCSSASCGCCREPLRVMPCAGDLGGQQDGLSCRGTRRSTAPRHPASRRKAFPRGGGRRSGIAEVGNRAPALGCEQKGGSINDIIADLVGKGSTRRCSGR